MHALLLPRHSRLCFPRPKHPRTHVPVIGYMVSSLAQTGRSVQHLPAAASSSPGSESAQASCPPCPERESQTEPVARAGGARCDAQATCNMWNAPSHTLDGLLGVPKDSRWRRTRAHCKCCVGAWRRERITGRLVRRTAAHARANHGCAARQTDSNLCRSFRSCLQSNGARGWTRWRLR